MKRVIFSLAGILSMLLITGFTSPDRPMEDVRQLDTFTGIGISISADVYYTTGTSHEIRIEGKDKDVEDLITEVKDGFLQVKYENWKISRSKLTIYITSKELEDVKMSGSGHFSAEKSISSEEMGLAMSGSGGITFTKLQAEEVDVKISGSGNISLNSGSAEEMDVKLSGSGKVNAEQFEVSEFSAAISGSGSIKIDCKEELDVKISGSGKVYYHGNPRVNSVSSGSGKVVSL
jgi:hypothetical protein